MNHRKENFLRKIGFFHVHICDKAGFCIICNHLARPERKEQLIDFDPEYDDPEEATIEFLDVLENNHQPIYCGRSSVVGSKSYSLDGCAIQHEGKLLVSSWKCCIHHSCADGNVYSKRAVKPD
jgi:hypothetical protein